MKEFISVSLFVGSGVCIMGCDPHSKVVRSRQDDPKANDKKGGDAADSKDKDPFTAEDASPSPGPVPFPSSEPAGGAEPVRTPSVSTEEDGELPVSPSGAVASGKCDTGDWGACFREARPLIQSDPSKAIELYLKACLPGEKTGDGLACAAAARLSAATGNVAGAKQYDQAACTKDKFPVLLGCRER